MRWFLSIFAIFTIVASPAVAQQQIGAVTLAPISYSENFQGELAESYGVREGSYLSAFLARTLAREIQKQGDAITASPAMIVEVTIVDAAPNRPTIKQMTDRTGLDLRSISVGGAELNAVLRSADGFVITEVRHSRYDRSISELTSGTSTWSAAQRAIRQFANKVADAYAANAR